MEKWLAQGARDLFFKRKGEGALEDAAKFTAAFAICAAVFYGALSLTGNLLNWLVAYGAAFAAKPFFEVSVAQGAFPHLIGWANGSAFDAQIIDLCSGGLEIAVVAAMVAASRDKPLHERLRGIALGVLVVYIFNVARIVTTLYFAGTQYLAVVHDVLFRVSLVLVLLVFYAFWYYWGFSQQKATL